MRSNRPISGGTQRRTRVTMTFMILVLTSLESPLIFLHGLFQVSLVWSSICFVIPFFV